MYFLLVLLDQNDLFKFEQYYKTTRKEHIASFSCAWYVKLNESSVLQQLSYIMALFELDGDM